MPVDGPLKTRPAFWGISTALFAGAFLLMCICEAYTIPGLWFGQAPPWRSIKGADLPFLLWVPCVAGIALRFAIGKRLKKGEITPSTASLLNISIGGLLLMAYSLMVRLAEVAFS